MEAIDIDDTAVGKCVINGKNRIGNIGHMLVVLFWVQEKNTKDTGREKKYIGMKFCPLGCSALVLGTILSERYSAGYCKRSRCSGDSSGASGGYAVGKWMDGAWTSIFGNRYSKKVKGICRKAMVSMGWIKLITDSNRLRSICAIEVQSYCKNMYKKRDRSDFG